MYQLRWDRITESLRLHSVKCKFSPDTTDSRNVLWSEVFDDRGDAV